MLSLQKSILDIVLSHSTRLHNLNVKVLAKDYICIINATLIE